jgi:hypothetical protein
MDDDDERMLRLLKKWRAGLAFIEDVAGKEAEIERLKVDNAALEAENASLKRRGPVYGKVGFVLQLTPEMRSILQPRDDLATTRVFLVGQGLKCNADWRWTWRDPNAT